MGMNKRDCSWFLKADKRLWSTVFTDTDFIVKSVCSLRHCWKTRSTHLPLEKPKERLEIWNSQLTAEEKTDLLSAMRRSVWVPSSVHKDTRLMSRWGSDFQPLLVTPPKKVFVKRQKNAIYTAHKAACVTHKARLLAITDTHQRLHAAVESFTFLRTKTFEQTCKSKWFMQRSGVT